MESTLKKISKDQSELFIELGKEELVKFIDKAETLLSRDLHIDGFRKGKAPKDLVKRHFGEQFILETALDLAVKQSLAETIKEKDLEVLKASSLNIVENSSQRLIYKVLLTLFPEIKLPDLRTIKVKRREVQVTSEEVNNTLEDIRSSRATFLDKDEPVENGDRVEIDFEAFINGQAIEGGVSKNHPLIVGKKTFIPGFEEKLVGMRKGEETTFSLNAPENYFNKDIAGKELDFKVKVVDVKKVTLPTLDDGFAKLLGNFGNFQDLEASVRDGILAEKKSKERERLLVEAVSKITEKSDIKVTEDLIDQKVEEMVARFDQDLHQKGMELSLYLAHINKTQDELRQDWRENADKQLKTSLIIQKISEEKKINASEAEVEEAVSQAIQMLSARGDVQSDSLDLEKIKEEVASKIINDKTLSYIESICISA